LSELLIIDSKEFHPLSLLSPFVYSERLSESLCDKLRGLELVSS